MIKSAQSLWKRTVEVARESVPEHFLSYPFAADLRLGWYPSSVFFQNESQEPFFQAMPDITGAVFPYHYDFGTLSHLIINAYREDGTLHPRRRSLLCNGERKYRRRPAGIFGIHRLKTKRESITITDDEILVCKHPNVIALSQPSPKLAHLIMRSAGSVNLRSEDPKWLEVMYGLSRHGLQVQVNDRPLVEHIVDVVVRMYHDKVGLSLVTHRFTSLISHLVPMERRAVIELLKRATNLNFEHVLPDDFHIYRREADFYQSAQEKLMAVVAEVCLTPYGMTLTTKTGDLYAVPYNKTAVAAAICQITDTKLDLVDWAYHELKEIPSFYLHRDREQLEPRAVVSDRIADVVMTILSRAARIKQ